MISGICPNCEHVTDFSGAAPFSRIKCPKCNTELIVPKMYGDYQLTDILDEYSIMKNYKGHNLQTEEPVIITILNKKFSDFRKCLNLCRKEAKDLSSIIKHHGIVPITDYGEHENTFYAVSPYTKGFRLSEYNPQNLGEFESESVFHAFKAIAAILNDAHRNGFEHHNICPENILIDKEGRVKILNFFPNRIIYKYELGKKDGFSVSPYYISPEKAEKGTEDSKGDIFSLGILLYFMLSGQYPFDGKNNNAIIFSRVKRHHLKSTQYPYKPPTPIDKIRKDIPVEYADFVNELLMPYPVQRPTASGIINKLNLIEAELERQKSFEFYSKAVTFQANPKSKINSELSNALNKGNLSLKYQPIVNIKTNKVIGLEALLRWPNSPVGNIPAGHFIPEAEESGLIHDLGLWVIQTACKQLAKWIKSGFNDLYITINISPEQLKKENFQNNFFNILKKNNINPQQVEFELALPKSDIANELPPSQYTDFAKFFNSRISIAELGDNFTSLKSQISQIKLHSLKIDEVYIKNVKKAKKELSCFKNIIAFANFLSVQTVAEKVETKKQLDFLSKAGCSAAQGFYFYRPMSENKITELLSKESG